jgi:hypothetical protein
MTECQNSQAKAARVYFVELTGPPASTSNSLMSWRGCHVDFTSRTSKRRYVRTLKIPTLLARTGLLAFIDHMERPSKD